LIHFIRTVCSSPHRIFAVHTLTCRFTHMVGCTYAHYGSRLPTRPFPHVYTHFTLSLYTGHIGLNFTRTYTHVLAIRFGSTFLNSRSVYRHLSRTVPGLPHHGSRACTTAAFLLHAHRTGLFLYTTRQFTHLVAGSHGLHWFAYTRYYFARYNAATHAHTTPIPPQRTHTPFTPTHLTLHARTVLHHTWDFYLSLPLPHVFRPVLVRHFTHTASLVATRLSHRFGYTRHLVRFPYTRLPRTHGATV